MNAALQVHHHYIRCTVQVFMILFPFFVSQKHVTFLHTLTQVQFSVPYLYFRQHGDNRGHNAEQHVEADEELVDEASIRLGVEDEGQHDSNK